MPTRKKASPPPSLDEWKALADAERREMIQSWDPYTDDGQPLLREIGEEFRREYGHLRGLTVHGTGTYHGGVKVVGVTHRLVFDRRLLPDRYLGLPVHASVSGIPEDFRVFKSYIWAPENYEHLVDEHTAEVREQLGNPQMSREEMLHALCGREFDEWVTVCRGWGREYTNK